VPPGQNTTPPYQPCIFRAQALAASSPPTDAPPRPCAQGRAAPAAVLWFAAAGAPAACSSFSNRIRSRRRAWDSAAASLFISRRMRYSSARHASSAALAPLQAPKNLVKGCPSWHVERARMASWHCVVSQPSGWVGGRAGGKRTAGKEEKDSQRKSRHAIQHSHMRAKEMSQTECERNLIVRGTVGVDVGRRGLRNRGWRDPETSNTARKTTGKVGRQWKRTDGCRWAAKWGCIAAPAGKRDANQRRETVEGVHTATRRRHERA